MNFYHGSSQVGVAIRIVSGIIVVMHFVAALALFKADLTLYHLLYLLQNFCKESCPLCISYNVL
jgi:hypothetical protein